MFWNMEWVTRSKVSYGSRFVKDCFAKKRNIESSKSRWQPQVGEVDFTEESFQMCAD